MRRAVLSFGLAGLLIAGFGLVGCSSAFRAEETYRLEGKWDGFEKLVVRTRNGRVSVNVVQGDSFSVSGNKYASGATPDEANERLADLQITAAPSADDPRTLLVEATYDDPIGWRNIGASMDVVIPQSCKTDVSTSNGSISARNLAHETQLHTNNGRVTVENVAAAVEVRTSNGRIEVTDCGGGLRAATSNGAINVRNLRGDARLESSNGSIVVAGAAGSVEATTSNGRIDVEAAPPAEGVVSLQSSNGSIVARLANAAGLKGRISLTTSNGSLSPDLGPVAITDMRQGKHSLEGTMNGGGAGQLRARTSNGSLTVVCR